MLHISHDLPQKEFLPKVAMLEPKVAMLEPKVAMLEPKVAILEPHYAFHSLCFRGRRSTPKQSESNTPIKTPRPKIFGGIICTTINDQKKYALVQGRYTGKWSFPKGHSNEGEAPIQCTKREVWEETGIEKLPDPIEYLKIGYGYYYVFILSSDYPLVPQDTHEIIKTAWVSLEDMKSMELNADVNQFMRSQQRTYK